MQLRTHTEFLTIGLTLGESALFILGAGHCLLFWFAMYTVS